MLNSGVQPVCVVARVHACACVVATRPGPIKEMQSRGLHWDWVPPGPAGPNPNLAGAGGLNFAAGGNGRVKQNTAGSGLT